MTENAADAVTGETRRPTLAMSLLNDFLYCPRRAALKVLEGWREENEHTARGDVVHEHADLEGYEVVAGVTLLRALPVFSERLGLNGKCDIVEAVPNTTFGVRTAELISDSPHVGSYRSLTPVEYKKGKRQRFENDDAQLGAQALCLEEMFRVKIERGAVFHAESKRRRLVEFTADLRELTEQAIRDLHALCAGQDSEREPRLPAAVFKPACEECSLFEICLPRLTSHPPELARAGRELFEPP